MGFVKIFRKNNVQDAYSPKIRAYGIRRNETKQLVIDETKQSLTLEKSGNCSSAAPNTLDTIAVLFR